MVNRLNLIKAIEKFGTIEVCKAETVLTILITGEGLSNMKTVCGLGAAIGEHCGEYKYVETVKNSDTFYLSVLKRKTL